MPNLDIIYDVTIEVTWDERKTNKQVIYQTSSLPIFVTLDAFYFCLWPKTLGFQRYLGRKALATDHRVYCGSSISKLSSGISFDRRLDGWCEDDESSTHRSTEYSELRSDVMSTDWALRKNWSILSTNVTPLLHNTADLVLPSEILIRQVL